MKRRKEQQGETLTRNELAQMLYSDVGAHADCYEFVSKFFEVLGDAIAADEPVIIHGFGRWRCRRKKARQARNPRTGEPVMIAPRRVVTFVGGKQFKNMLINDGEPRG